MRVVIGVLAALACTVASAQASTAFEFKGVPLGASLAEFQQVHQAYLCEAKRSTLGDTSCHLSPELKCLSTTLGDAGRECRAIVEKAQTYGGYRVKSIGAFFYDGLGLGSVVLRISPDNFEALLTMLVEKYGEPKSFGTKALQNRMGASFESATAVWERAGDELILEKYGARVDEGRLVMRSKAYAEEFVRRNAARKERARSDL